MTVCISTSGPYAILALFDAEGGLIRRESRESNRAASAAIFEMLELFEVQQMAKIVVDVGPGSFTGVRVGVTIGKMLAHLESLPIFAVSAFDLLGSGPVAIPSKKGEVYLRVPGEEPGTIKVAEAMEVSGILFADDAELSQLFSFLPVDRLEESDALSLTPLYVASPSISQAKQSHIMGETFGGRGSV